jgi:hypothetical protein
LRCLRKKPEERFQSAAELLRALQAPVALGESMLLVGQPPRPAAAPARAPSDGPPPLPASGERAGGAHAGQAAGATAAQQEGARTRGVMGVLMRGLFTLIEVAIWAILLPVRGISAFAGRGVLWLMKLPLRIVGLLARLIGLLLVLALVVLVVVTLLQLFSV